MKAEPCAGLLRSGRQPACPAKRRTKAARQAYAAQRRACCPARDCSGVMPVHRAGHGQECLSCCSSAPGGCPEAQGVTGEALLQERLCNAGMLPSLREHTSGMPVTHCNTNGMLTADGLQISLVSIRSGVPTLCSARRMVQMIESCVR